MNKIFTCFLLTLAVLANAQSDKKINIGNLETIQSKILGEEREVWVHVPGFAGNSIYGETKYPVVYLLDGDAHFFSTVGTIRQFSSVNGNSFCPQMIVVGIPNTNRTRDLTPTKSKPEVPFVSPEMAEISGGGDKFLDFIEKELMPHIEANYPTEPYRMFVGHSFGGLTVMNTLRHRPELFNSYLAIDPSMWWDGKKLMNEIINTPDKKYENKSLFVSIANTMEGDMKIQEVDTDTTQSTKHIRSILKTDAFLKNQSENGLYYSSKYYDDEGHGSVPMRSLYDGLKFLFNFYDLSLDRSDFMKADKSLATKIENHYKNLTYRLGYEMKPPESLINDFGYNYLGMKEYELAEHFFKMNIANFPESANVYDSYADYFIARGKKKKAIKNLKKALSLKESNYSREKLEGLMKR